MRLLQIGLQLCMSIAILTPISTSQTKIGEDDSYGGAQGIFQKWFLVDDNTRVITIEGAIKEIKYNAGNPWDDKDWNVFIDPTAEFRWCKFNSLDQKNEDDRIELEVKSRLTDVREFFSVGDRVLAKGDWVEDAGHSAGNFDKPARTDIVWDDGIPYPKEFRGKTEIHPIRFLRTGSPASASNTICFYPDLSTTIFMAQDASGRFFDADDYHIQERFHFRANEIGNPSFVVDLSSDQVGSGAVELYRETTHIKGGTVVHLTHDDETLNLDVSVPPYTSGEGGAFLGIFDNQREPLLSYSTKSTFIPGMTPGTDEIEFEIEVELTHPNDANFTERWWCWQENMLDGSDVWLSTTDLQKISYAVKYAPSRGLNNSYWGLYVLANSRSWDWHPTSTTSPSGRVCAFSGGYFGFRKSTVSYTKEAIEASYACGREGTSGQEMTIWLREGYSIKLKAQLMASANLIEKNWFVKVFEDGDGTPLSDPTETLINQSTQDVLGLTVQLGSSEDWLEVKFKTVGTSHMGSSGSMATGVAQRGKCQVVFRGKTNFGEEVQFITPLLSGRSIGMCEAGLSMGRDWEINIVKGLMALNKLYEMGLLSQDLPTVWPNEVVEDTLRYASIGEVYKLGDKLGGENKSLVEAYRRYTIGEVLGYKDLVLMRRMVAMAAKLPDIRALPSKKRRVDWRFDRASSPDLMAPHDILKLTNSNIRRSASFWQEAAKHISRRFR